MANRAVKGFLYLLGSVLHSLLDKRMTRKIGPGLPDQEIERPIQFYDYHHTFGGWLSP